VDDALRSLERRLRAAEGDLALAREYRRALGRLDAARAAAPLAALTGALCVPAATGEQADPALDPAPRWERVAVGPHAPVLRAQGPFGAGGAPPARVDVRWRAEGRARWASATLVLLEQPDRTLEARCARTGRVLWSIPAVGPGRPRGLIDHDTERTTILGWAVAPWGAVALTARHEARVEGTRRASSASWRPRETERRVLSRGSSHVEATLQVVLAPGGLWSIDDRPQDLVERPGGGGFFDGDLHLESWDDDLFALALDVSAPCFAVRWRDADQDWAVFEAGLGPDGAAWAGPAAWTAAGDEDPVGRADRLAPARVQVDRERHVVVHHERTVAIPRHVDEVAALALDEGLLLRVRDDDGLDRLLALDPARDAFVPCADWLPAGLLDDLELRFWDEGPVDSPDSPPRTATLLPAGDLLLVQAGDALVALGAAP
jgi:hypothetical protein